MDPKPFKELSSREALYFSLKAPDIGESMPFSGEPADSSGR